MIIYTIFLVLSSIFFTFFIFAHFQAVVANSLTNPHSKFYPKIFRTQRINFFYKQKKSRNYVPAFQRRGWDSNPRALSDKRFSRPPRYDHFDTSAYSVFITLFATYLILPFVIEFVNIFLNIFSLFKKSFCNKKIFWCRNLNILI